jgi:hypothetical protein
MTGKSERQRPLERPDGIADTSSLFQRLPKQTMRVD